MGALDFDRSVAIVIGINQYGHGIAPLRTAVADARAIAEILEQEHKYQVISLIDEQAHLTALKGLIQSKLPSLLSSNSRLLLYFAGHGIAQDGNDGPAGYLIPQDATPGNVDSYLPMVELHDALTVLPCRHFLAVFDCCFAGAFRWSSTRDIDFVPEVIHQERFDRFRRDPAWQVITSASYDQKAMDVLSLRDDRGEIEGAAEQHSPFAAALMQALQGGADAFPPAMKDKPAGDGVITATELYLYLRDSVEVLTEGQKKRQTPEICSLNNHDKGEYIFLTPGHELNLPPAPELKKENNPYRGLESFEEEHSELFFGRDKEIEKLLEKIEDPHPLTVVLGASGTGKSSLVKAGLLPLLEKRSDFQILPVMRPGNYPIDALAKACKELAQDHEIRKIPYQFSTDEWSFCQLIERWHKTHKSQKLLLVIDQAEELITQSLTDGEASQFLRLLKQAMTGNGEFLHVVATLRLDFEAQFQNDEWREKWMDSRFVVPPMTQAQLREAIEQPAARRVLYFEPHSLVDTLVEDVAQTPGALPLLSFTLSELYLRYLGNRSDNRALTELDYRALGGVAGSLTRRATQEYEELVAKATTYTQSIKHVMLRMVAVEGGELARRRVPLSELVYANQAENSRVQVLLSRLIEARLVVQGQEGEGDPYVEPVHDALVRGWDKLLHWKKQEQVNLSLQRQLTPQARNWQTEQNSGHFKQSKGFLWDNNPRLELLKEVLTSDKNWLNVFEERFIRRSIARRHNRRRRLVASLLGVIAVLSGLSVFAVVQAIQANNQKILADVTTSKALILAHKPLEGMAAAVKAWQSMEALPWHRPKISRQVRMALAGATYYDRVFNRDEVATEGGAKIGFRERLLLKHQGAVWGAVFSPDGSYVVTASDDKTVKLWDVRSGQLIQSFPSEQDTNAENEGHRAEVRSVAFSTDGNTIATASVDKTVKLWDVDSGQMLQNLQGHHQEPVWSVAFNNNNTTLASASHDQTVNLWDVATGQLIQTFPKKHNPDKAHSKWNLVAFSLDGNTLASAIDNDETTTIQLWDVNTGTPIKTLAGHSKKVTSVAFSLDGQRLVSTSDDKTIRIWELASGNETQIIEENISSIWGIVFNPEGTLLAAANENLTIEIWDIEHEKLLNTLEGHSDWIWDIAFSPGGEHLVSASRDQTAKLWSLHSKELEDLPQTLSGHSGMVRNIAFNPEGDRLASVSDDTTIKLWDINSKQLFKTLKGHLDSVTSVAFNPEGNILASGSKDSTVQIWDADSGQILQVLEDHTNEVNSVAFSPINNSVMASGSTDATVKLWNVKTGQLLDTLKHSSGIWNVTFSPRGDFLAVASNDQTVTLWNMKTKGIAKALRGHSDAVRSVAFHPDGEILASASNDRTVKLWNIATGEEIHTLVGHKYWVESVSFSPDGSILASASYDQIIRLWDVDTGELLTVLDGHHSWDWTVKEDDVLYSNSVLSVAFSPRGKMLASASHDRTVKLWALNPERLANWNCEWLRGYLTENLKDEPQRMAKRLCENTYTNAADAQDVQNKVRR